LASALFYLQQRRDPSVTFEPLTGRPFGQNLRDFEAALKKFPDSLAVQIGLDACTKMREVSNWRNERVHARVDFDQHAMTLALYSWRTRERLAISPEEIQQKIARASELVFAVNSTLEHVLHQLDFDKMMADIFSEIDTTKLD